MSPYRTPATPSIQLGPRWGVSLRKKWYVRIARLFINLREKYSYNREYRQYERDLADWKAKYGTQFYEVDHPLTNGPNWRQIYANPPMPAPPPIRISE